MLDGTRPCPDAPANTPVPCPDSQPADAIGPAAAAGGGGGVYVVSGSAGSSSGRAAEPTYLEPVSPPPRTSQAPDTGYNPGGDNNLYEEAPEQRALPASPAAAEKKECPKCGGQLTAFGQPCSICGATTTITVKSLGDGRTEVGEGWGVGE